MNKKTAIILFYNIVVLVILSSSLEPGYKGLMMIATIGFIGLQAYHSEQTKANSDQA